ncbi:helix-turn-helix domain-containing protein [Alpinimonas psychrophila]|uniref:AraC-like DNA-binding protein n=1 Tax=Alpinimonas psychrophila TaxID=748908 RepID=A0A7W3JV72_9MICO|nr:AraC-like DNA-binding protein [Alpinimonas psychrophila]
MENEWRGILYPTRLPTLHRIPAPPHVSGLVRWFWIPEWNIADGLVSRQELLPFAASNLVVEAGSVALVGPPTGPSFRELTGQGWAVGALLRPAAMPHFLTKPSTIRDTQMNIDAPDLCDAISAEMTAPREAQTNRSRAVAAYSAWIVNNITLPTPAGIQANTMADLIDADPSLIYVEHIAKQLHVSVRTVQRIAEKYFGLSPLTLIRRRRLQTAAETLRTQPSTAVAAIAADLGYADHAHLTNEFRDTLDSTPSSYRRGHEPRTTQNSGQHPTSR